MALIPGVTGEEVKRLLHTVIVGGGPTGVEFGAELYDFIRQVYELNLKIKHIDIISKFQYSVRI